MADFLLSVGVDVGLSYEEMQKDISVLVSQLNSNPPLIKVALDIDSNAVTNLRNQISELSKTLNSAGAVQAGSNVSSAAAVNAQLRERISLENEAGRAATSAASEKQIADDQSMKSEAARQALLKKSYTLLTQMQNAETKWTAAKNGKSSSAYTAIQSDIASLQQWNIQFKNKQITAEEFSAKLSSLSASFTTNSNTIKEAGEATQTWGSRLKGLSEKFATWFSITRVIMAAYRAVRAMVSAVTDLDTAMTELKKVTNETEERYDQFLDNAASRAKKLGASLTDVVNASADFARLGLSIEDAEAVSDAALVYKNVGDGITDINHASESIISTMQAFGVEAKDAMSIVDKLNVTGNKFAISSGGVGDALLNSAAALNAAGNSLDESIGLITAANTTIQDPEKVGTALKTISMYLRAAKTEAEEAGESTDGMAESVSELRNEILSLTGDRVDIQINDDTFKSTYQILKELSEVWGDLSDVSQANITELIGGKRNSNVISALLKDFDIAENATAQAAVSAGSALEENDKVLESIDGKVQVLKASFQELSQNIIGSGIVKFFVDLGTTLINLINGVTNVINAFGGFRTALLAVASVLLIAKGGLIAYKIQLIAVAAVKKIIAFFTSLKNGIINIVNIIPNAIVAWKAYAAGTITASSAMQASIPVIGLVLSALTMLTGVMALTSDSSEEMSEEVEDTSQNIQDLASAAAEGSDNIETLTSCYLNASNALNTLTGTVEAYNNSRDDLIEGLGIEQTELQKLIDKYGSYDKALASASLSKLKDYEIDLRGGLDVAGGKLGEAPITDVIGNHGVYVGIATDGIASVEEEMTDALNALLEKLPDNLKMYWHTQGMPVEKDNYDNLKEAYHITADEPTSAEIEAYGWNNAKVLRKYETYKEALQILSDSVGTDNILYKEIYESYSAIKGAAEEFIKARDDLNSNLANQYILEAIINGETPKTQVEFDAWRQNIVDAAVASGEFSGTLDVVTASIDGVLKQEPQFKKFYSDMSSASENTATNVLASTQQLESGFEKLGSIYSDVYDKGTFDWGSIINNEEFAETFGSLGDSYTNFIKTVSSSSSDIDACQEAFNNLAQAYLANSNVLNEVTDETRDAVVAMLTQMGVASAASIVDYQLAYNKEKLKYATGEYVDMAYSEIVSLYKQCEAGSATQQVLAELAIAKMITNENAIKTSADIEQLIALANSANATAASLNNLSQAKALMADAENYKALADAAFANGELSHSFTYLFQAHSAWAKAQEYLDKPLEYNAIDPNKFTIDYTGGSASGQSSSKQETWFEKQLASHKHMVAMEQETEEEYLKWLDTAYQKAYKEQIITLDDYYKYQEEVFTGLKDLFKDSINDIEHEISMRENYDGESEKIASLHIKAMTEIEKRIAEARARGLDDTSDFIQELQGMWQDHANSYKDLYDDIEEEAKDSIDELIDYRIDMLKQEIKDEKDALDTRLDNLKDFYDKQKEMLQDQRDEEKYLDEQSEKRKTITDLEAELAMLENDNSAWAQKRKLEIQEEISTAKEDLAEFEDDHALDLALDALDNAYDAQEAQIKAEMDALEEKLNDPEALFNQALSDIKNNTGGLYDEMLEYNRKHGTGNDEDVKDIYEEAFKALSEYEDLHGEPYKGIILPNSTNYKSDTGSWDTEKISGANPDNNPKDTSSNKDTSTNQNSKPTPPALTKGSTVKIKSTAQKFSNGETMASFVPGGSYTVYQVSKDGKEVLIGKNGVYTGWVYKTDIDGYASGTSNATAGLHEIDEIGSEYLFTSSNGSRYRVLNSGDKVLNANATDFLYKFANSGGEILEKIIKSIFGTKIFDKITPSVVHNDISVGGITVQGNADSRTVSEIRRAQRDNLTEMLKNLNKLNK